MAIPNAISAKIRNMSIVAAFLVVVIHCRPEFARGTIEWWVKQFLEGGVTHIAVPFWFPSLVQWGFSAAECPLLSPLWYVRALFLMVLLSPVFWKGFEKLGIWVLVCLFILYGAICPFTGMPATWPLHGYSRNGLFPVLGFFYFALGMAIRGGIVRDGSIKFPPLCSLAIGLAFVALRAIMLSKEIPGAYFAGFLSVPFVLYGIWSLIPTTPWPGWLTAYSFSVYLIHKFVMYVNVRNQGICQPRGGAGICQYFGVAIASFSISLAIAVAIHRVFSKLSRFMFGGR